MLLFHTQWYGLLSLIGWQVRSLEAHMYPEKLKVIAQQVQLQQQQEQVRLLHQEKLEREQQIRTQVSALTPPPISHRPNPLEITCGPNADPVLSSSAGRFQMVLPTASCAGV